MAAKQRILGSVVPLKTLKILLGLIIDRRFLAEFTWSGKSVPGVRKIAFRDLNHIVDLIYDMTSKVHTKYTRPSYHKDLVDRVLKFAHE